MPFNELGRDVDTAETIARYIVWRNHFAPERHRVKPKALEPARDNHTSVFRIVDLSEPEIWRLGHEEVEAKRDCTILARADLQVSKVQRVTLRVVPLEPPPRHANIVDWPAAKEERMSLAQQLAAEAILQVRPVAEE